MENFQIVDFIKPNNVKLKSLSKEKEIVLSKNKVKRMFEASVINVVNPELLRPKI